MKLTKNLKRFDTKDRPMIGDDVFFSPGVQLTIYEFEERQIELKPLNIKTGMKCRVLNNTKYLTEVQFSHRDCTDLVSPCFLISFELTEAAEKAMRAVEQVLAM